MTQDKYYGFQELAELAEHVIKQLFSVSPVAVGGLETAPEPSTLITKNSPPPLAEFIAYALYRTRLPVSITHQALLLLTRLKARYPSARGTATSPHRLFLSSLMLSSKISMDDTYSNKSWQVVGQGLFTLREVNQMERELFAFLGWNVVVRDEELAAFVHDVVDVYERERSATAPEALLFSTAAAAAPRVEKRRRSTSSDSHSSSSSRSPSPEDRHRRASDAAVALLQGSVATPSPTRRSRTRTPPEYRSSSYSPRPSSTYSSSSSTLGSPQSGFSTPGSPSTPISAGPLTPTHTEEHLAPAWARTCKEDSGVTHHDFSSAEAIAVAAW